jgi:hypothetical protein
MPPEPIFLFRMGSAHVQRQLLEIFEMGVLPPAGVASEHELILAGRGT